MNYAIYLRKSRADLEYENEIDTLVKHEKTLLEFAEKRGLTISNIYREVVSRRYYRLSSSNAAIASRC